MDCIVSLMKSERRHVNVPFPWVSLLYELARSIPYKESPGTRPGPRGGN